MDRHPSQLLLWMGVHRSARAVQRMKALTDYLIDAFARLGRTLDPKR
jgi:hypothetical protein